MRILRYISALAMVGAALAGCRDKPPEPPQLSQAMPDVPLPPLATVLSRAGSEDALQLTFRSSLSSEEMVTYYRRILSSGVWSLVSDTRMRDGTTSLYAEREGPPLWVSIRPDTAGPGSLLSIGGAVARFRPDTMVPQ